MHKIRRAALIIAGAAWLLPFYLLIVNSVRPSTAYDVASVWRPPQGFGLFTNLKEAWNSADLGPSIGSSVLYSLAAPAISVLIGALAGFAIIALRLRHGFAWFMVIFGGSIFPAQMLLVPVFIGYSDINLFDTRIGMVLIYSALSIPLAAFVMRNFFSGVAYSLYESATMDGASSLRVFASIYLPLSRSALGAVFVLEATFVWNELLFGLTLTQSESVRPIMTSLASLQSAYSGTTVPVVLAAGLLVSLPTVILFLAAQRLFARGLALGQF